MQHPDIHINKNVIRRNFKTLTSGFSVCTFAMSKKLLFNLKFEKMKPEESTQKKDVREENDALKEEKLTEQEKEQLEGGVKAEDLTSNTQNPDINIVNCHGC